MMNILFFPQLSLWLPSSISAQAKDNYFVQTTISPPAVHNDMTGTECESQYSCVGCHQVRICSTSPDGKYRQVAVVNCTDVTPYCKEDSGTCTGIMPDKCAAMSENFMCMRESGTYPDPTNCTRFHLCRNYTAYTFACYGGTLYNSRTGACERTECLKFNCANKNGLKVPYGTNKNVYAYCVHGLLWFVDRCPTGHELNELTQNCEPVCKVEGFFVDYSDPAAYYVCRRDPTRGNSLWAFRHVCPAGMLFDLDYVHCATTSRKSRPPVPIAGILL